MSQQYPQYQPAPPQPPKKAHTARNVIIAVVAMGAALLVAVVLSVGAALDGTDATKSTSEASDPAPAVTEPTTPVDDSQPPAVEETTAPPEDPGVATIGASQWFTYDDGLQVQVTKAKPYRIGPYAAGGKPGGQGVIVTVTIKNGTAGVFDADLVSVELSSGPNGTQAEQVFDSGNVGNGFEGSIAKGRSKTATYAFAVPKAHLKQLSIEVAPSWDHSGSIFEGAAK